MENWMIFHCHLSLPEQTCWLSAAHLPSFRHVLISPPIRRSIHIFNVTLLGLEKNSGNRRRIHPPHFQQENWKAVEVMFADHDRLPSTLSLIISKARCGFFWHRPDVYLPSRLAWWLEIVFKLIPFTWKGLLLGISLKYSPNTKPKPSTNSSHFVCSWIKFCYA